MESHNEQMPVPPYQQAHEILEKGKESLRLALGLIADGRPVQNETHGLNIDNMVDSMREAASVLDDRDDVKAAELRAKAVELRTFSRTVSDQMRSTEGFRPKEAFQKLADEILMLDSMEL